MQPLPPMNKSAFLKQGEKQQATLTAAQVKTEISRIMDLTTAPAGVESDDHNEHETSLPSPKPYYQRSRLGCISQHNFSIQGILERARSEPERTPDFDFRQEQLTSDCMTRSMPNLQCSRASHNKSLGLSFIRLQCKEIQENAQERAASRVAEFCHLLEDL